MPRSSSLYPRIRRFAPVAAALVALLLLSSRPHAFAQSQPYFFPPEPPICGTPIFAGQTIDFRFVAPDDLKPFVNESFYFTLGALYPNDQLTAQLRRRLAAYLKNRRGLETELRSTLASAALLAPPERRAALARSGGQQREKLLALEREAEEFRRTFLQLGREWHADRKIRIGASERIPEANVIAATAFYRPELTLTQRDLMQELAIELAAKTSRGPEPIIAPDRRALFLLPCAARIIVPVTPPPELAEKLSAYETLKAQLKQELLVTIHKTDLLKYSASHPIWKQRVEQQRERLGLLEQLAENVREALAATPALPLSRAPALPPELEQKLTQFRREAKAVKSEIYARIEKLRRKNHVFEAYTYLEPSMLMWTYPMLPNGDVSGTPLPVYSLPQLRHVVSNGDPAILKKAARAMRAFHEQHKARFDALDTLGQSLAAELAAKYGTQQPNAAPKNILTLFVQLAEQAEAWPRYEEYRAAILEPGLTPEQRRLLFGMALEALDLPLPGGAFPPRG